MTLSQTTVELDILVTVLIEVERIMNSRPLTYALSDIQDLTVLTPACFLYPKAILLSPAYYHLIHQGGPVTLFMAKGSQPSRPYIGQGGPKNTSLQKRAKWFNKPNLYEGQIVLLTDDQTSHDQRTFI